MPKTDSGKQARRARQQRFAPVKPKKPTPLITFASDKPGNKDVIKQNIHKYARKANNRYYMRVNQGFTREQALEDDEYKIYRSIERVEQKRLNNLLTNEKRIKEAKESDDFRVAVGRTPRVGEASNALDGMVTRNIMEFIGDNTFPSKRHSFGEARKNPHVNAPAVERVVQDIVKSNLFPVKEEEEEQGRNKAIRDFRALKRRMDEMEAHLGAGGDLDQEMQDSFNASFESIRNEL